LQMSILRNRTDYLISKTLTRCLTRVLIIQMIQISQVVKSKLPSAKVNKRKQSCSCNLFGRNCPTVRI
jgi:hypothetical protein